MRALDAALVFGLLASPGYGQARFESVEIRPSSHVWNAVMQGGLFRAGR